MAQYIDKSALVAEIERIDKSIGCDRFLSEYEIGCNQGKEEVCDTLRNFLDTLEVKDAIDALRTEYEKGRADVIAKACQFLNDYQEYPDHDISPTQLMEAFRLFMQIKD